MIRSTVDLIALYQFDSTILDGLIVPDGIDLDITKEAILMESAEQEILYNNVGFLKTAIASWAKKQLPVWTKLYETTMYEYNPIWNKDGKIVHIETRDLKGSKQVEDGNAHTDNLTDTRTLNTKNIREEELDNVRTFDNTDTQTLNTSQNTNMTETTNTSSNANRDVFGFNSDKAQPSEATGQKGNTTDTNTGSVSQTGTVADSHDGTIEDEGSNEITETQTGTITDHKTGNATDNRNIKEGSTDTGTIKNETIETGNIGVTSTQSLILEQREVVQFNIIDHITKDFIKRFCLSVY